MRGDAEGRLEGAAEAKTVDAAGPRQFVEADVLVKVRVQVVAGAQGHAGDLWVARQALAPVPARLC